MTFCENAQIENLFTKFLACKHLRLLEPFLAYVMVGDVRPRIYLYYVGFEKQLQNWRRLGRQYEKRKVNWVDYNIQMVQQFYGLNYETMNKWETNLESVLQLV